MSGESPAPSSVQPHVSIGLPAEVTVKIEAMVMVPAFGQDIAAQVDSLFAREGWSVMYVTAESTARPGCLQIVLGKVGR